MSAKLSVVIITLNEEKRLQACLRSLPKGSEIIVVDSGSSDRTCAMAHACGARVEVRPFDNYANQKNAAIELATGAWVLSVDADERLDHKLVEELERVTSDAAERAYKVRRRLVFLGRPLQYGKAVDHPVRLFPRGQAKFAADIHERLEFQGPIGQLKGEMTHYSYEDLTDYFARFNRYTSAIAANHWRNGRAPRNGLGHWLRPWGEFFYRYVIRLGFLDGYPGYTYALVSSLYTFVKYAKLKELAAAKSRV